MANIKSQIKRTITNEKRRLANASFKSSLKTAIKNVEQAVQQKNKDVATEALTLAFKKLDKSVSKGIHHKNFAARQKSRLAKQVESI
ncbi:MAG: 30S ribosomal protein S20 [Bacilli bacterium]|nr:30S ribosomal protein S20 [Bacilli bacterium]MBN2696837.1 30S ribosomal protein S20 [Bacilli bacterium]